jgi:hypothetical protein
VARYKLPERSFTFELSGGREIIGYPIALAVDREFLRDGTMEALRDPKKDPEKFEAAAIRYLAAVLRKDEAFVLREFDSVQIGYAAAVAAVESYPKTEGDVGPEARSP